MDKRDMRERLQQVLEQYAKSPNWTPRQEMKQPLFWKAIRAEFMGSLILMVFSSSSDNYIGPICYGCTVVVLTYSFKATNPHFNPVISLAALLLRSLTPFRCCSVTLAQTLGTLSGATIVSLGLTGNATQMLAPQILVSPAEGFGYEFFGCFLLTLALASHLERPSDDPVYPFMAGLATGTSSGMARLGTGGFLNPIRASSLALFQDSWTYHYIYWVGPLLGTLLAVFTFDFIRPSPRTKLSMNNDARNMNLSTIIKQDSDFTQPDTDVTIAT